MNSVLVPFTARNELKPIILVGVEYSWVCGYKFVNKAHVDWVYNNDWNPIIRGGIVVQL